MKKRNNDQKYIMLSDQHLWISDTISEIQKQSGLMIEEREFKRIDNHYIVNLNDQAIDFLIDKKRMSNIPWQHLIKKDVTLNYMLYGVIALLIIILLRG